MAIRITDNLMNRPLTPGDGPRGLDQNPERVLGNYVAPANASPRVNPNAGPYAGMENPAAARTMEMQGEMVQAASRVLQDTALKFEALKVADEDARGTTASIKVRERERDLRKSLAVQSAENYWSADEEQQQYAEQLQKIRDEEFEKANISHAKLAQKYEQDWEVNKSNYVGDYQQKVLQPRIVANAQKSVQANLQSELKAVADDGTVQSAEVAWGNIGKYMSNPAVMAVLGPAEVQRQLDVAKRAITETVISKTQDRVLDIDRGPLKDMSGDAINDQVVVQDMRSQLDYVLDNLPLDNEDREKLRVGLHRELDQKANSKQTDIRQEAAEQERNRREATRLLVGQVDVVLGAAAAEDKLTRSQLETQISSLRKTLPADAESQLVAEQLRVRYLDNIHRAEKERAKEQASQAAGNTPGADQASTDKAFKTFAKGQFSGKSFEELASNPQTRDAVLAATSTWMKQNNVLKLPKDVDGTVSKMLLSHEKDTFNQGYAIYQQLRQVHPELVGQLDDRAVEMASRVGDGQTYEAARTAMVARSTRTKEQIQAERDLARREVDREKERGAASDLAKSLGGTSLTPQVWSAYQREVDDGIAMGLPVSAAKTRAQSAVATRSGKSTLVDPSGKVTVMLDAPEKVFGTTAENIKEDILSKGKELGLSKDSKFTLHPTGRMDSAGRPLYAVAVYKKDNTIEFLTGDTGNRVLYSYDARTAPATKRAMEARAHIQTVDLYNDMMQTGLRDKTIKAVPVDKAVKSSSSRVSSAPAYQNMFLSRDMSEADLKNQPGFNSQLWELAKKQVIRE